MRSPTVETQLLCLHIIRSLRCSITLTFSAQHLANQSKINGLLKRALLPPSSGYCAKIHIHPYMRHLILHFESV